jgi:hypothetical protein
VIYVDDGIFSHNIVLPLFDNMYQGIDPLVICRVIEDLLMKYFRMVAVGRPPYIRTTPIAYPLASISMSKGFLNFGSTCTSA